METNFVNVTLTTDSLVDIYVDDEYKGKGSWSRRLSDDVYFVEARETSHRSVKQSINLVLSKDENITIKNPLPIYNDLNINSTSMGATIFID